MAIKGKAFLFFVILGSVTAGPVHLTLCSDAASKYSSTSNKQLQSTASGLVKKIRELVDSFYKKDRELMEDYNINYLATRTTERQTITDQYRSNLSEALNSNVRDYKEKLSAESKAVRAELQRRLPKRMHRPQLSKIYENPSIVMEIEIIASDLELLSKSLPGTWSIAELKQKATDLVGQLRSFIRAGQKEYTELYLACGQEGSRANTEERQSPAKQRCDNDAINLSEKHVSFYNERFKSEAIFLREEILFRLPNEYRSKIESRIIFEFPRNLNGMETIATSLEQLGKTLPARSAR